MSSDIVVVIAAYSRQETLTQALGSLDSQSLLPDEIVVVDDCSPTPLKLDSAGFEFPRSVQLSLIRTSVNIGTASARNLGVNSSHSNLLCFLDHDDLAMRDKLRIQSQAIYDGADIVVHRCQSFEKMTTQMFPISFGEPYVMQSSLMIKRTTFEELGMMKPIPGGDDMEILLHAKKRGLKVEMIDEVLLHRRVDDENLSLQIDRRLTMLHALRSAIIQDL